MTLEWLELSTYSDVRNIMSFCSLWLCFKFFCSDPVPVISSCQPSPSFHSLHFYKPLNLMSQFLLCPFSINIFSHSGGNKWHKRIVMTSSDNHQLFPFAFALCLSICGHTCAQVTCHPAWEARDLLPGCSALCLLTCGHTCTQVTCHRSHACPNMHGHSNNHRLQPHSLLIARRQYSIATLFVSYSLRLSIATKGLAYWPTELKTHKSLLA